jgi:secreted Zn-dependent insulinase-like peptidase
MIKSFIDERKYRVIRLQNNIEVILIHDPNNQKSAASMTVGTGSFEDSEEAPGLAHLTEHMLFSGSKRFSNPSEFEDQLGYNYGSTNTFTEEEKTSFFFEINWEGFDKALYMFSRMFAEPLINPDAIHLVLNHIQEEIEATKGKDQWREHQVIKSLANPTHPFSRFSLGNLEKLRKLDKHYLASLVRVYFNKFYTAQNMKLVVSSSMNIEMLQNLIDTYFSDIREDSIEENQKVRYGEVVNNAKAFTFSQLGQIVWYQKKPKYLTPTLDFIFTFDEVMSKQNIYVKPLDYISYILKYSGQGSLTHYLKKNNLAIKVDVGTIASFKTFSQFAISIYLTEKGLDQAQEVIDSTFGYFNKLRSSTDKFIVPKIFEEIKSIEENKFNFQSREDNLSRHLSTISMSMFDYELKESLRNENFYKNFNSTVIENFVKALIPENVIIIIGSNQLLPNIKELVEKEQESQENVPSQQDDLLNAPTRKLKNNRQNKKHKFSSNEKPHGNHTLYEPIFDVLYLHKKLSKEQVNNLLNIQKNFTVRGENNFVSRNLNLISCFGSGNKNEVQKFLEKNKFNSTSMKKCEKEKIEIAPKLIKNTQRLKIWYRQDRTFLIPRVQVYFNILSKDLRFEINNFLNFNIFFEYLKLRVETRLSEALDAGNEIKLEMNENGINISINCYSDVMEQIVEKILSFIFDKEKSKKYMTEDRLREIISMAEERLRTSYHKTPLDAIRQIFNKIVKKGTFTTNEVKKVLFSKNYKVTQFNQIMSNIIKEFYIDTLVYGNLDEKNYKKLENLFDNYILQIWPNNNNSSESNLDAFKLMDDLHSHNLIDGLFTFKKFRNKTKKANSTEKAKNYVANFYQVGSRTVKNHLLMSLMEMIWGNMFNYNIKILNKVGHVLSAKKEVIDNVLVR